MKLTRSTEMFELFCFYRIAHYMKLPVIAFSSAGASRWSDEMVKNPVNPSYNPNIYFGFTESMSFFQRIINSATALVDLVFYQ